MTADVEDDYYIAQATEPLDEEGTSCQQHASPAATADEIISVDREMIDYHGRLAAA